MSAFYTRASTIYPRNVLTCGALLIGTEKTGDGACDGRENRGVINLLQHKKDAAKSSAAKIKSTAYRLTPCDKSVANGEMWCNKKGAVKPMQ